MSRIRITPCLPACGARLRRLACPPAAVLALAFAAASSSCREDATGPTSRNDAGAPAPTTVATNTLAFNQVSAGWQHVCGVTTDSRAYCWGNNSEGALGDGEPVSSASSAHPTPIAVAGGLQFRQVSAGSFATCGVTTDYHAYCWGANELGELGDGTTIDRGAPVPVAGGLRFRQVETNFEHTCGVTYPDHRAFCWGDNSDGQLGTGTNTGPQTGNFGPYSATPVAVARALPFRQVTTGYYHTCGVTTDDRAFCWGLNRYGQIGDSSTAFRRLMPSRVGKALQWRQIDAGAYHTCAVTTDDRGFCWGNGRAGQVGNGKAYLSFWPKAVAGGLSLARVSAGYDHTCGETSLNRVYCWGANYNGQLGDGTTTQRLTPVAVAGGHQFSQASVGVAHSCARTPDAAAYCWGRGFLGELGNGTIGASSSPVAVAGPM